MKTNSQSGTAPGTMLARRIPCVLFLLLLADLFSTHTFFCLLRGNQSLPIAHCQLSKHSPSFPHLLLHSSVSIH